MKKFMLMALCFLLMGCATAAKHRNLVDDDGDRLTVATVQRKILVGMPSSAVIEALGSPNVISTDEQRREVWVYDKISSNVTYSNSESGAAFLLVGGSGNSGSRSTSQKTLTIIVKFDNEGKVRDFAYHTSRF